MSHLWRKKIPFSLKSQNQKQRKSNVEIQDLNSPRPIPSKLPYPDEDVAKDFKQLRLRDWIGKKDDLVEMPKFNKMVKLVTKDQEKLEEIVFLAQGVGSSITDVIRLPACSSLITGRLNSRQHDLKDNA
ncbi:hypothetical protein Tco_0359599 [Tanacetum coccineum]